MRESKNKKIVHSASQVSPHLTSRISVKLNVLYGSNSWMTHLEEEDFRQAGVAGEVEVKYIEGAGHHIYSDQAEEFNNSLSKLLQSQDPCNSQ